MIRSRIHTDTHVRCGGAAPGRLLGELLVVVGVNRRLFVLAVAAFPFISTI
jgi:hypothetical protein